MAGLTRPRSRSWSFQSRISRSPTCRGFCFQYNVLELNTAAKPYFLSYLLDKTGCQKLVYLDPDILVLHQLDELERCWMITILS